MPKRDSLTAVVALSLSCLPSLARGQVPAGAEFRVNTYTTGNQLEPVIASNVSGSFVVAWTSDPLVTIAGIFARRYDAAGQPVGVEFRVDAGGRPYAFRPAIAMDDRGRFLVAWTGYFPGPENDIFARLYDPSGRALGGEFRVNTYTTHSQALPAIAARPDGGFVVAWESQGQDGSGQGVFAQRLDVSGRAVGAEFRVNTTTADEQTDVSVAVAPSGAFVVVWQGFGVDGSETAVVAQRYDASGTPRGGELRVNSYTSFQQLFPSVSADPAGNFVVAWTSQYEDGSGLGLFGQRFDAALAPQGPEFRLNENTLSDQLAPVLAADGGGGFVVAWRGVDTGGGYMDVFGRRLAAGALPRGAEFKVNTYTTDMQGLGNHVAGDGAGNFVVTWWSFGQDGSYAGVYAQRYGGLFPLALAVDEAGNRVWEPGETVDVKPTWRNASGAAQSITGSLANLQGPAGATYTIVDGSGSYGTVASGGSAPCADCYTVVVSAPAARPLPHWDASVVERLSPDAQGQARLWTLHVGSSFTDVPTGNGFYRFVETLLHRGVTGGCGASTYCPSASASRAQMAVFVLVAREGAGYVPPACGTPVFNDVPASSGFCRYIEELARRGVVTGCGGGNYCPADPVSRDQMAVFISGTFGLTLYGP